MMLIKFIAAAVKGDLGAGRTREFDENTVHTFRRISRSAKKKKEKKIGEGGLHASTIS